MIRKCLAIIIMLPLLSCANEMQYKQGKHYHVYEKAHSELSGQTLIFFNYSCSYCFRIKDSIYEMKSDLSKKTIINLVPASLGNTRYEKAVYVHYMMVHFDALSQYYDYAYKVIHKPTDVEKEKYEKLRFENGVKSFFSDMGKTEGEVAAAYLSAQRKLIEAERLAGRLQVNATPAVVVNGKYLVSGLPEGPDPGGELIKLVKYLLDK